MRTRRAARLAGEQAASGGACASSTTEAAPSRNKRRAAEISDVNTLAPAGKRRAKAVAAAPVEAVAEAQTATVTPPVTVPPAADAAEDSTKARPKLDDECSTCEPGAAEAEAQQAEGGRSQAEEEQDEDEGAWPSDEDDDGDFYAGGSDVSEPGAQADARNCTRQANCLDENARRVRQQEEVREVAELLGVDESGASLLLRSAAWNKEALLSSYMDDAEKVCAAAGVPGPSTPLSEVKRSQRQAGFECCICRSDEGELPVSSLACGHTFCDECWQQYLTLKVDGGDVNICCPEPKCGLQVPSELVEKLCEERVTAKFQGFLLDSFVNDSKTAVWCPRPSCGLAVDTTTGEGEGKFVTCGQGHSFCLECKHEAHAPASCDVVKTWLQKCDDDSETFNWLSANTQDCPKCSSTIEKNGGCNHMTCRQCKHEFCWVCRGAWSLHGDAYSCNRWQDDKGVKEKEGSRQASRAALERYLFYYHRYNNHELSMRLDQQNLAKAAQKMEEIQAREPERLWGDVQFVAEATVGLAACRLVLKWTYVLAHSLVDESAEKNLFCFLQEDLETKTEQLSGLLETPPETIITAVVRNKVLVLVSLVADARRKLLRGVDEGLQTGGGGGGSGSGGASGASVVVGR